MQILLEVTITLVAVALAVFGLLYAGWPLIEAILRFYQRHRHHQHHPNKPRNGNPNHRNGLPLKNRLGSAGLRSWRLDNIWQAWSERPEDDPPQSLSGYQQLVKLMNDDPQVVDILLKKLAYQVPNQPQEWYCNVVLKQIQRWIANRISDDADNPTYGEQQVSRYLAKYPDRPNWWVYRKLAQDYGLFKNLPTNFGNM